MAAISTKNSKREFTVYRDEAGVPHVKAKDWLDAIYALGYMHATDRGTQLLFARAVASGRAAELISDRSDLRETDRFFKRIGLHRNLASEALQLDDHISEQIYSYCEGINDGVAATGRSLPMWATGFRPDEPWDAEAVLLVGQLLSFGGLAIGQMQNERLLLELIHAGVNEEGLKDLYSPRMDSADFELLRRVKMSNQLSNDALDTITDLPRLAGSNAWATRQIRPRFARVHFRNEVIGRCKGLLVRGRLEDMTLKRRVGASRHGLRWAIESQQPPHTSATKESTCKVEVIKFTPLHFGLLQRAFICSPY